jgi:hypothetical protein
LNSRLKRDLFPIFTGAFSFVWQSAVAAATI